MAEVGKMAKQQVRAERMGDLADEAMNVMMGVLKGDTVDKNRAEHASRVLGVWAKTEQTQSARERLAYQMISDFTHSDEDRQRYIELTMPHHAITRALPARKEAA